MGLKDAFAALDWRQSAVSAQEAVALVPPGATVYIGGGCAVPETLVKALEEAALEHPGTFLLHYLTYLVDGPFTDMLRHRTLIVGPDDAELAARGRAQYLPMHLNDVPRAMFEGRLNVDATFVQVSPPDARGMCSLGISVGLEVAAVERAPLVIAEINEAMPRVRGAALVPFSSFDAVVAVEPTLAEYSPMQLPTQPEKVARYAARLVGDGATVQASLGRIPSEVLEHLGSRRDLGIHTEVLTDAILHLVDAGVVTGRYKGSHKGKVLAAGAMGSKALYERVTDESVFVFKPLDKIADPAVVARQNKFVSITQAYSADLTGQVCLEAQDGHLFGGVGNASVFHFAAARSPGGRAIICLPSVDAHGRSTIRPVLDPLEAVTIPRYDIRWVVTEYGATYLHGKSLSERAVDLIEISHPDHRVFLLSEAKRLGLIPHDQKMRSRRDYPVEEARTLRLKDGAEVEIRPTVTGDASKVQALFYELDPEDVYTRFFRNLSSLTRQAAEHLCSVSYQDEMAFAAVLGEAETGEEIIATSSYYLNPDTGLADVAYMVSPRFQGQGLGTALHARTVEYAKENGVRGFTADILEENPAMLSVFAKGPGHLSTHVSHGVYEIELLFEEPPVSSYTTSSIPVIRD